MSEYYVPFNMMQKMRPGDKNPEDIEDITTRQEIIAQVEKEIKDAENHITVLSVGKLSDQEEKLLHRTLGFVQDTSNRFRIKLLDLLEKHRQDHTKFSADFLRKLTELKFDLPNFTISDYNKSRQVLDQFGFNRVEIERGHLVVVFDLPKPLSYFWWKDSRYESDEKRKPGNGVIEWGRLYREVMPDIHIQMDFEAPAEHLSFNRINDISEHEAGEYYYIWEVELIR